MRIAIIGRGAISSYVQQALAQEGVEVAALIGRPDGAGDPAATPPLLTDVADLPEGVDLVLDCAGHAGLRSHGAAALRRGLDVITLSLGALADASLATELRRAAEAGGAQLQLASGAIGALDALRAAAVGGLDRVTYLGRKPPKGWAESAAEETLDLNTLTEAAAHFRGTAREAALRYPKNANVAAAVALAALGFDRTEVVLIADPAVDQNIHEVTAEGAFGTLQFTISGNSLPGNPRSSALAAMSAVAAVLERRKPIGF